MASHSVMSLFQWTSNGTCCSQLLKKLMDHSPEKLMAPSIHLLCLLVVMPQLERESQEETHSLTSAPTSLLRNLEMLPTSRRTTFLVTLHNLRQKKEASNLEQDFGHYSRADKTQKKSPTTKLSLVGLSKTVAENLLDIQVRT